MNQRQLARQCTLEAVASLPNLFTPAWKARRGKSRRPDVEAWWMRRESELAALRAELLSRQYRPAGYRLKPRDRASGGNRTVKTRMVVHR
jgi:hypothetical protein